MESFGETLRKTREARELDLERVSSETNITVNYLDALEKEMITVFPSESYLIGFLKNYSEYLNLNPDELVNMYRAMKIQIEAAPLDKLLEPQKKIPWYLIIGVSLGVVILTVATILIVKSNTKRAAMRDEVVLAMPEHSTYKVSAKPVQKRVYAGDIIEVFISEDKEPFVLSVSDTSGVLILDTPMGTQVVELGEESEIDLDGNIGGELSVFLSDISKTDAARGAEVQMLVISPESENTNVAEIQNENEETINLGTELVAETTTSGLKRTIIFEGVSAYPVTLNATFRNQCMFRYKVDNSTPVENFLTSNQSVSISANNGFRIWMSNANAVKLQVIGGGRSVDLEIGRPGQVLVEDIKWIRDDDGKYKLVVMQVE